MSAPRPDWQLKPHGTTAAARRHRRRGERLCEACRRAETRKIAEYREQHPEWAAAVDEARRRRYREVRDAGLSVRDARAAANSPARHAQLLAGVS